MNAKAYSLDQADVLSLQEPTVAYGMELVTAARKGIRRRDFVGFAKRINQSVQSLAKVIPASYSSLSKKEIYNQETSERILEIVRVYACGQEVFGSIEKFNDWMFKKSVIFDQQRPFDLLDTSFGIELVLQEIGRIDHGVFA